MTQNSWPFKMPYRRECKDQGLARAFKDATEMAQKAPGNLLIAACTLALAALFFAPPRSSYDHRLLFGLAGLVLGFVLGMVVLAIWSLTPAGRNRHWRCWDIRDPAGPEFHSLLVIRSECWHNVRNVECRVTTPDGTKFIARETFRADMDLAIPPDETLSNSYPHLFLNKLGAAPMPVPGKYKVKWTTEIPNGKRRTLRRWTWKVTD